MILMDINANVNQIGLEEIVNVNVQMERLSMEIVIFSWQIRKIIGMQMKFART